MTDPTQKLWEAVLLLAGSVEAVASYRTAAVQDALAKVRALAGEAQTRTKPTLSGKDYSHIRICFEEVEQVLAALTAESTTVRNALHALDEAIHWRDHHQESSVPPVEEMTGSQMAVGLLRRLVEWEEGARKVTANKYHPSEHMVLWTAWDNLYADVEAFLALAALAPSIPVPPVGDPEVGLEDVRDLRLPLTDINALYQITRERCAGRDGADWESLATYLNSIVHAVIAESSSSPVPDSGDVKMLRVCADLCESSSQPCGASKARNSAYHAAFANLRNAIENLPSLPISVPDSGEEWRTRGQKEGIQTVLDVLRCHGYEKARDAVIETLYPDDSAPSPIGSPSEGEGTVHLVGKFVNAAGGARWEPSLSHPVEGTEVVVQEWTPAMTNRPHRRGPSGRIEYLETVGGTVWLLCEYPDIHAPPLTGEPR